MKDVFFIACGLGLSVLRIAKDLVKIFLFLGVVWGAFVSFEIVGSDAALYLSDISVWFSNHWVNLAIILIMLKTIDTNKKVSELRRTSKYTEMFIGSSLSYFEIEPQTEDMLKLKTQSFWHLWKGKIAASALFYLMGSKEFSRLVAAKSVRDGQYVSFKKDLKSYADKEN